MTDALRSHLVSLLQWQDAHVSFERAVEGVPPELRGLQPPGSPHSLWQIVEHLRITQLDILAFCRPQPYVEMAWPGDYWPETAEPPTAEAWDASIGAFLADRAELVAMAQDPAIDLLAVVPNGSTQSYLRELLLVADHNAYHVGQLVTARRALGAWHS